MEKRNIYALRTTTAMALVWAKNGPEALETVRQGAYAQHFQIKVRIKRLQRVSLATGQVLEPIIYQTGLS